MVYLALTGLDILIILFIIPLSVQWWSSWYPGAEPGGGGYIAQRMLASKNEKDAVYATLFFNIMHYAIRPWPWILIALCSLIIFPDLNSISDTVRDLITFYYLMPLIILAFSILVCMCSPFSFMRK